MIFDDPRQENIDKHLFATPSHHAYAVVDGAALPGLLPRLYNYPADYTRLYWAGSDGVGHKSLMPVAEST